jgi:hypothetical protein
VSKLPSWDELKAAKADKVAQKHAADQDAAGVDMAAAERGADVWLAAALRKLADDPVLLTAVHLAIENELVELRDGGIVIGSRDRMPANGLVIKYPDGSSSEIIRMGTRDAVKLTLTSAADHLEGKF